MAWTVPVVACPKSAALNVSIPIAARLRSTSHGATKYEIKLERTLPPIHNRMGEATPNDSEPSRIGWRIG